MEHGPALPSALTLSLRTVEGYFLLQVSLDLVRGRLRLLLSPTRPTTKRIEHSSSNVHLIIDGVSNISRVEAFFFGRKLAAPEKRPEQVTDCRETRTGCSLELTHAGRVAIRTRERPVVQSEEAGEQ